MTRNQAPKRVKLKAGRVYAGENGLVVLCLRKRTQTAFEYAMGMKKRVFVCQVLRQDKSWDPVSSPQNTWREDGAFYWETSWIGDADFDPIHALTREIRK